MKYTQLVRGAEVTVQGHTRATMTITEQNGAMTAAEHSYRFREAADKKSALIQLRNVLESSLASQELLRTRKWFFHQHNLMNYGQNLAMVCQSTPGPKQSLLVSR